MTNPRTSPDPGPGPRCPVVDFNPSGRHPAGYTADLLNRMRAEHPVIRSSHGPGFWILTRYGDIRRALENPVVFSSSAITVLDPSPKVRWIPEMLDPPEHTTWRRLLRPLFTARRAAALHDRITTHCTELIESLAPYGHCDLVEEFAFQYPTVIFLELLGLPASHLPQFLRWERVILHQPDTPDRTSARRDALRELTAYLSDLIEERRRNPTDPTDSADAAGDIVSAALTFTIDDRPVTTGELLGLLTLLLMAGLDTVTATLSYMFWHLATHPADRHRITRGVTRDPATIPDAVEELLRAYTITLTARKLTADTEIAGCRMREGDMVLLPLTSADHDPAAFAQPDHVDLTRADNRHLAFGAGPHRCLGAHLARTELRIALAEWHTRIPDYELAGDTPPYEHADQVLGLESLHLRWKPL